jgi:hypothetical protein
MSKMKLLDAIQTNTAVLSTAAHEMECLADSFLDVGNDMVAKKLERWALNLRDVQEIVKAAHSADLYGQVQQAQESSVNVLNGVLAGIEVGIKAKEEGQ